MTCLCLKMLTRKRARVRKSLKCEIGVNRVERAARIGREAKQGWELNVTTIDSKGTSGPFQSQRPFFLGNSTNEFHRQHNLETCVARVLRIERDE